MCLCVGRERSAEELSDNIPVKQVGNRADVHMPEKLPEKSQIDKEEYSRKGYPLPHPSVDDVALLVAWLVFHNPAVRWQG